MNADGEERGVLKLTEGATLNLTCRVTSTKPGEVGSGTKNISRSRTWSRTRNKEQEDGREQEDRREQEYIREQEDGREQEYIREQNQEKEAGRWHGAGSRI